MNTHAKHRNTFIRYRIHIVKPIVCVRTNWFSTINYWICSIILQINEIFLITLIISSVWYFGQKIFEMIARNECVLGNSVHLISEFTKKMPSAVSASITHKIQKHSFQWITRLMTLSSSVRCKTQTITNINVMLSESMHNLSGFEEKNTQQNELEERNGMDESKKKYILCYYFYCCR